jgi:hypothetical protein
MRLVLQPGLSAKISEIAGVDHHNSSKHRSSTTARAPASSPQATQHALGSCSPFHHRADIDHRLSLLRQLAFHRTHQLRHAQTMGICSSCLGGRKTSEADVSPVILFAVAQCISLTLSCSTQIARTCSETLTSPTMVPPVAPTTRPSPTQRSFAVSERTWSVFVLRRTSESCLPRPPPLLLHSPPFQPSHFPPS